MPKSGSTAVLERSNDSCSVSDEGAFGAPYRVLIGFATIPAMQLLFGSEGSDWTLVPFLLLVLLLLRAGLAVVRKLVPFSAELREAWSVRRRTAKLYNSYQWRKLMWIGAGLALLSRSPGATGQSRSRCPVLPHRGSGGDGEWHAVAADSKYPKPRAKRSSVAA